MTSKSKKPLGRKRRQTAMGRFSTNPAEGYPDLLAIERVSQENQIALVASPFGI
jgi:hypothetical protein